MKLRRFKMKLSKIITWRNYVKVWQYGEEPNPYYFQWIVWCWRRPIYIGLPLVFLTPVFLVVDMVIGLLWVITRWGK